MSVASLIMDSDGTPVIGKVLTFKPDVQCFIIIVATVGITRR